MSNGRGDDSWPGSVGHAPWAATSDGSSPSQHPSAAPQSSARSAPTGQPPIAAPEHLYPSPPGLSVSGPQSTPTARSVPVGSQRTNPVSAWYRRARSRRVVGPFLRIAVLTLGVLVTLLGLVLVPLPGPGWAIVFLGLALTATEFRPARSLLEFARGTVRMWTDWLMERPMWVRLGVTLATFALVAGITFTVWTYGRAILG